MRKGFEARVLLTKKGEILAIGTGSDACAEHEGGSAKLQEYLCGDSYASENIEAKLRAMIARGEVPTMDWPQVIDQKLITRNLSLIRAVDSSVVVPGHGNVEVLVVGFVPPYEPMSEEQLDQRLLSCAREATSIYRGLDGNLPAWAGAWDNRSFCFVAVGEKNIKKLRTFAEKLKNRAGMFAGTFLQEKLTGVIIALTEHLRPEHKAKIQEAQAKWENDLLLKAYARTDELFKESRNQQPYSFIHFWPVWHNEETREVAYAVNPGCNDTLSYYGPYKFEDLMAWLQTPRKDRKRLQAWTR